MTKTPRELNIFWHKALTNKNCPLWGSKLQLSTLKSTCKSIFRQLCKLNFKEIICCECPYVDVCPSRCHIFQKKE